MNTVGRLGLVSRVQQRSLIDIFAATASANPDAVALEIAGENLTYAELERVAARFASGLSTLGVGPGDRVGVRVTSGTADLYVAILGVLFSGACYVPVDADDPDARAQAIWRIANVCAVVGDGLTVTEVVAPRSCARPRSIDDDAWVMFTSGSTGAPKGVAVTHRSAAALVDAEAELWLVTPADRVLACLSVAFDASCEEMWLAWRHGATLVPAPRDVVRSGVDFGSWLLQRRISVVSTVPTLAALWGEDVLADVRLLILGGESCPEELGWRLARRRDVWNTYGPTEATVVSTACRIVSDEPVRIGWPLSGWKIAVVDDSGRPVALGEPGELVIAGVGLARYLDADLDAERFASLPSLGWERAYRSGDIVRETADGLVFIGRRDEQVKIGGRRIELGEIDAQLHALPGVHAAITIVRRTESGNAVLVGYVTGDIDADTARRVLSERLPAEMVPLVVVLDAMPVKTSGKVDRAALPWPTPIPQAVSDDLHGTAAWLAERWVEQIGPHSLSIDSDFFELGGSSIAAAKLVSVLRERFPSAAVADIYHHRRLGELAHRLDSLTANAPSNPDAGLAESRGWGLAQVGGVLLVLALRSPVWLLTVLSYNDLTHGSSGPTVPWVWLVVAWLVFVSAPGRAGIVIAARRLLLGRLGPGRYPRYGWLACRLWFVERLAEVYRFNNLAGTPWAGPYARLCGHTVGIGVHLATLPPPSSLISIGDGASVESAVDLHGWWVDGADIVLGPIHIGSGARIGARSVLMPGARVGPNADVEPGSVVGGTVPAGERWCGSPARPAEVTADQWPSHPAPRASQPRLWRAMYAVGLGIETVLPLLAIAPGFALLYALVPARPHFHDWTVLSLKVAPAFAAVYLIAEILLLGVLFRAASRLLRPGWHPDTGSVAWAVWFTQSLLEGALLTVFPLYSSVYTRGFLRVLGVRVGPRTEMSHAVTINRLVTVGGTSFAADDVGFLTNRCRGGWLHVAPIVVGSGSFLGNGALLRDGSSVGNHALVGVLSSAPDPVPAGTSWFGAPALELARVPDVVDPARTTAPRRSLVIARGATELVRILLPSTVSVALVALLLLTLEAAGGALGVSAMLGLAPLALLAAGLVATGVTIAAKWLLIGRYRPGRHPLWSAFVWRDEIINSCQEQLAGVWLLNAALATPLMPWYLRAMGARVGQNVWFETLNITEFDVVTLGDGCVINRACHIETHLFQDRVMRIGPTDIGRGATMAPGSAVLPDTVLGSLCVLGARSVVLQGEELPNGTRWHGAPVVAM